MEYLLTAFWGMLDLVSYQFFLSAFLPVKTSKRVYRYSFMFAWLLLQINTYWGLPSQYQQIIPFILLFFICIINYRGSLLQKSLYLIIVYIFGALLDTAIAYGSCALLEITFDELLWKKITYTIVVSIGKILMVLLCWVVHKNRTRKTPEPLHKKWNFLVLLFPISSLAMLAVVFHGSRNREDLSIGSVVLSVILAISNTAIIYLIHMLENNTIETRKLALLNQQMEIQTNNALTLQKSYHSQRKIIHEFSNQLQTIQGLISSRHFETAQEYINHIHSSVPVRVFTINSHHPIIDAILNQKYQQATDLGIDFQVQLNDLSEVSINTDCLVVLLSNLLDNAIEACQRYIGDTAINCTMLLSTSFYVSVRNTSYPVQINNNRIPTSKEPKEEHGYGLAHIEYILNQLGAEFIFAFNDGWFEFAAEIPLNE